MLNFHNNRLFPWLVSQKDGKSLNNSGSDEETKEKNYGMSRGDASENLIISEERNPTSVELADIHQ